MNYAGARFAVLSHVLPPLPSGQSILLSRLLQPLPVATYCLISSAVEPIPQAGRLPGRHAQLRPVPRLRKIGSLAGTRPVLWINTWWGVHHRARQVETILRQEGCDLVIGCTGDLLDLPAAWLAARRTGRPFIAYIMDDYINQWTGYRRRIAAYFEKKVVRDARSVLVLNEFVQNLYRERYAIEANVLHNPITLPDLTCLDKAGAVFDPGTINIVYAGSVYQAQRDAFVNFVKAVDALHKPNIRLHIYSSQTREEIEAQGIDSPAIVFHPHVPHEQILLALRQADLLFLPLAFKSQIQEVIKTSAPFKTSEYLAVARPIFVHAPADAFLSWYFRTHQCGVVVDQDDVAAVSQALLAVLADQELSGRLAARARVMAEADFSNDKIGPLFLAQLNAALN